MKNIKSISFLLLAMTMLISSCRKEDNANLPDLERVPIPLMTIATGADVLIQDPAEFKSKFTVDLLFKEDVAPKQVDVVVAMNGNYKVLKTLQAGVTAFPTSIDVDANKLAQLFGLDASKIVPGDFFEIGANVTTQSGFQVPAFSELSNQYSADVQNFPGSSISIKYTAVCPLDLDDFVGEFTIDDPGFWEASYPVEITREGENVLVIKGFVEDPDAVLKLTVDPQTNRVTVPKQTFAPGAFVGYTNGAAAGNGEMNACDTEINLNLAFTVDQGGFGTFGLTIHK